MTISARFHIAGHAAADWTQGNPVLLDRELAAERDTGKFKLGDGAKAWADLPYQPFWSRWGRIEGQIADQPDVVAALTARLQKTANLSDLTDYVFARANLGLKALSVRDSINGGDWSGADLSLADGGTGASTASAARTNLGLGAAATQDYAEGVFTPSVFIGGSATGITYSSRTARYTKVGRLVFVQMSVVLSSKGTGSGNVAIGGLPFVAAAASTVPGSLIFSAVNGIATPSLGISASSNAVNLFSFNGSSLAFVTAANLTNTSEFYVSVTYTI